MSLKHNLIKSYFSVFSSIAPQKAGKSAFQLFQKTQQKNIRARELPFFEKTTEFKVPFKQEDLYCYKAGNINNPWVLLVHGWNSNIASMHAILEQLVQHNYYVIGLNLPAHGPSRLKRTNMLQCSEALQTLLEFTQPEQPISIVSHSFGSAVVSYSLTKFQLTANQLIYLTCPNSLGEAFEEYSAMIGLGRKAHDNMVQQAENILEQKLDKVVVSKLLNDNSYNHLTIIHDEFDKVIPFKDAQKIHQANPKSQLIGMQNIGHYRMLWNKELIQKVIDQLTVNEPTTVKNQKELAAIN